MDTTRELNYRLYVQKEENFTRATIKSEFSKYNDIKFGNLEKVIENTKYIKSNYYEGKGKLSDDLLRNNIYHMVVAAGIIARVCIDAGMPHDESYTLSDIYIRKADKCTKPTEVINLLCEMQIDYCKRMKNLRKEVAISSHIRNAIDYIYDHLHEPLTMNEVAEHEKLNPSYFSKLFAKETGVTAKAYILNAKILTAKNMIMYSDHSLSEISLALGFSSQSAFAQAFKNNVGITPGEYKKVANFREIIG